jgi:hypothetical protein
LTFQLLNLSQSLQGRDLGHLRIIADLWGLEFDPPDVRVGLQRLAPMLLQPDLVEEVVEGLPGEARAALAELLRNQGVFPWSAFTRKYGAVREMGSARRDRERPFESDRSSATEALWYRGMIGRAFFDTPDGPQEFAYIPEDLLKALPAFDEREERLLGRPASPLERDHSFPANDTILDDACTLLAALRLGKAAEEVEELIGCEFAAGYRLTYQILFGLLDAANLLDPDGLPQPDATRDFLEAPRGEALRILVWDWLHSPNFNELRLLPGLSAEGDWQNNPLRAREMILDFLSTLPGYDPEQSDAQPIERSFWSLAAFVSAIGKFYPDFQRPAGDYDSWYLRDQASGAYLQGFQNWDAVDGELIRFIIAGPMHWLGLMDLATPEQAASKLAIATAFRFSDWAADLLIHDLPPALKPEEERFTVRSDGRIRVPHNAPRAGRYLIARFCEWDGMADGFYRYRLTPKSLQHAREQGLRVSHLLTLLRRYSIAVPPNLVKALERWETQGSEARLERATILRVKDAGLLKALRDSSAGRFLGEPLGPTAIIVHPDAWEKVLSALAETGYLGEIVIEKETSTNERKKMPE